MADSIDILVETDQSLEELVKALSHWFQFSFRLHIEEGAEVRYEHFHEHTRVIVLEQNYLINDQKLHFEDYRYVMSVFAGGYQSWEEDQSQRRAIAHRIYEQLKATKHSRLLMVENSQRFVEEYTPEVFPQEPTVLTLKARTLPHSLDINLSVELERPFDQFFEELTTYLGAGPVPLALKNDREGYEYILPTMRVTAVHKSSDSSLLMRASFTIHVEAHVRLPGGLRIPGERRYWVYEFIMGLFEHLKEIGRYRLCLRNEDEDRDIVVFDPKEMPVLASREKVDSWSNAVERAFRAVYYGGDYEREIDAFRGRWNGLEIEDFTCALESGTPEEKAVALFALNSSESSNAPAILSTALESKEPKERWASALCLGERKDEQALPVLLSLLEEFLPPRAHPLEREGGLYYSWRIKAASLLGEWGRRDLIPALRRALDKAWRLEQADIIDRKHAWHDYQDELVYALGRLDAFGTLVGFSLPAPRFQLWLVTLACGSLQVKSRYGDLLTQIQTNETLKEEIAQVLEQRFGVPDLQQSVYINSYAQIYLDRRSWV